MKPNDLTYRLDLLRYNFKRFRLRSLATSKYTEIVAEIDQAAFIERFRKYWSPFPSAKAHKFLDLSYWLREAVCTFHWLGINYAPPKLNVLDIGSGTGYFLLACRQAGHSVLGLDIEGEDLYSDAFTFFGLERIIHRIEPLRPIAELPHKMDLITAFQTCFNQYEDRSPWRAEEWIYLLRNLRALLNRRGRIVIRFNLNHVSGEYYSDEVRRAIASLPECRARFFLDYLFLTAT